MAHILIDGYNLIAKMEGISGNLEPQRERFIRKLSEYRAQKGHSITVVFDGEKGGWATESHERTLGINIVFSRLGEKADDVIKRIVKGRDEEENDGNRVVTTRKKGNPNKLSKAARRRKQRLDRL